MQYYWEETRKTIEPLIDEMRLLNIDVSQITELLDHNELGLALEFAIGTLLEMNIRISETMNNSILRAFYQMDCIPNISEDLINYGEIPISIGNIVDGGWVIAIANPPREAVLHFSKEFNEALSTIVLVRYESGYNEIFLNSHGDSITDNFYSNIYDCTVAVHKYLSKEIVFEYSWKFNEKIERKK
jgi:hypothetical protein